MNSTSINIQTQTNHNHILNPDLLQQAIDRLSIVDHIFNNNSPEYLTSLLDPDLSQINLPNSLPISLNTGICGLISDRLQLAKSYNDHQIAYFISYLNWRFFNDEMFPIQSDISDFPPDVQELMQFHRKHIKSASLDSRLQKEARLIYIFHQTRLCQQAYPLQQLDPRSPYGRARLDLISSLIPQMQEILAYARLVVEHGDIDYPIRDSVLVPDRERDSVLVPAHERSV